MRVYEGKSKSVQRFLKACLTRGRFAPFTIGMIWRLEDWSRSHRIPHICQVLALNALIVMIVLEGLVRAIFGIFRSRRGVSLKVISRSDAKRADGLESGPYRKGPFLELGN